MAAFPTTLADSSGSSADDFQLLRQDQFMCYSWLADHRQCPYCDRPLSGLPLVHHLLSRHPLRFTVECDQRAGRPVAERFLNSDQLREENERTRQCPDEGVLMMDNSNNYKAVDVQKTPHQTPSSPAGGSFRPTSLKAAVAASSSHQSLSHRPLPTFNPAHQRPAFFRHFKKTDFKTFRCRHFAYCAQHITRACDSMLQYGQCSAGLRCSFLHPMCPLERRGDSGHSGAMKAACIFSHMDDDEASRFSCHRCRQRGEDGPRRLY